MNIFDEFFTGINYWGSKDAIYMWEYFDAFSVEKDFILLKEAGITHLRVFLLWSYFQPLRAIYSPSGVFEYRLGEKKLPDTEAGRAGVNEKACEDFLTFCELAKKHGLKLIVGLITGHMSFRNFVPEAFNNLNCVTDPAVLRWEIKFVKYIVERFKDEKAIMAWDLGNEPNCLYAEWTRDQLYLWCSVIADAIKAIDPIRPVISGFATLTSVKGIHITLDIGDFCDINTVHPYQIFQTQTDPISSMKPVLDIAFLNQLSENLSGIPTFPQEFGAIGYMNCSIKTEADFYRCALLASLAHNCHGVMWWCAFDQGHLSYPPYDFNDIGSNYGFFTKEGTPKPIVEENLKFKELLEILPGKNLPEHRKDAVVLIPRTHSNKDIETVRSTFLLAKRANLDVSFVHMPEQTIPESQLYIIPSVDSNQNITKYRLDELLEKVMQGAVLYVSLGRGIMRDIAQTVGVGFAYREQIFSDTRFTFAGELLPISTDMKYTVEACSSEILAYDECGTPVFFRNEYGKGFVYLLTVPLERYCSIRTGLFHRENEPKYENIYKEIAKKAGIIRRVDSSSPFILLTEHEINDKETYILAINFSYRKEKTTITFNGDFIIQTVWGNEIKNGILELRENDGALFVLKEKV